MKTKQKKSNKKNRRANYTWVADAPQQVCRKCQRNFIWGESKKFCYWCKTGKQDGKPLAKDNTAKAAKSNKKRKGNR
jgi:hypothetical protein